MGNIIVNILGVAWCSVQSCAAVTATKQTKYSGDRIKIKTVGLTSTALFSEQPCAVFMSIMTGEPNLYAQLCQEVLQCDVHTHFLCVFCV